MTSVHQSTDRALRSETSGDAEISASTSTAERAQIIDHYGDSVEPAPVLQGEKTRDDGSSSTGHSVNSSRSISSREVDAGDVIPMVDLRPGIATFTKRQVQMLPICTAYGTQSLS
jgi:hypothetical protein